MEENNAWDLTKMKFLVQVAKKLILINQSSSLTFTLVDGEWSQWVSSGSCKTNGKRERTRNCTNPAPVNGGKQCLGSNKDEVPCPG